MKRKNKQLLGTLLAAGAGLAAAATAYKVNKMVKQDILDNFEEYSDENYTPKNEGKDLFVKLKSIFNKGEECCKEYDDENRDKYHFKNTMQYRRDRVYRKPLKGIKGEKSIY